MTLTLVCVVSSHFDLLLILSNSCRPLHLECVARVACSYCSVLGRPRYIVMDSLVLHIGTLVRRCAQYLTGNPRPTASQVQETMTMPSQLNRLPPELLLLVLRHLNVLDLGATILADYHLLHRFQIITDIPVLAALTSSNTTNLGQLTSSTPGLSCSEGFPLPLELWLQMDPLLSWEDKLNLASAMWPILVVRWNVGRRRR